MNHAGEIRTLVGIAEPDVRVWTNVGDAHIGFFGSREAIARAKAEILERATPATLVVANADDALVMSHVRQVRGPARDVRRVGGRRRARDVRSSIAASTARRADDRRRRPAQLQLTVPLAGRAQLSNVLAATAVALEFEIPLHGRSWRACRRWRRWRAAARSRALADGRAARRRFVQRQPGRGAGDARGARGDADVRPPDRGAGRDARAGRSGASRCTTRAAAPRPRAGVDELVVVGGPAGRRPGRRRGRRPDWIARASTASRTAPSAAEPRRAPRRGRAISCS